MLARWAYCTWLLAMGITVAPGHGLSATNLVALSVYPPQLELVAGGSAHSLFVTGHEGDGFEVSVSPSLASADPNIARIDAQGRIEPLEAGQTLITASLGTQSCTATVSVREKPADTRLSFLSDVLPVLSKAGCNAGACHAKKDGQNGFKLSVFAYDPQSDYQEIVRESRGRRISLAAPEESLLLKKPTMAITHGGGRRFDAGSASYRTLLNWINEGMTYERSKEPALEQIEIFPADRRYRKEAVQPLMVRARYQDGSWRDVTSLAEFESTDKDLVTVDEEGTARVGRMQGEGIIVARYMGMVAIARLTIPAERTFPSSFYTQLPLRNQVDRLVYARLEKLGLAPSEPCNDAEFLRRASLDAVGRLPTVEEARAFLADQRKDKRDRLIDRLLQEPGWADFWAVKWGDLIRPNPSRVGVKSVYLLDLWVREAFAQNKPYDQFVTELITATGSTHEYGPAVVFRDHREPANAGAFVSQIFLGVRMDCAQCHHHPNEKWSQADYYQLAAFFGRVKHKGQGISAPISGNPEFIYYAPGGEVRHPVTGEVMPPKPPDGPAREIGPDRDPRTVLASWMREPSNPFFARAAVNRVWGEFMGRGLVEPVDDFRASNPPSNEPLLDWLARDFVEHGYDLKHLMRTIMRSHIYQLSSWPNDSNLADTRNFSRSYRRRMPAEVLLDAVSAVTGTSEDFQGLAPGGRALTTWNHKLDSDFMDAFGRPNSSSECPCERDRQTSVVQALHLMNSGRLQEKLSDQRGRVTRLAAGALSPQEIVNELYLLSYARLPTVEERNRAVQAFCAEGATRQTATEDVLWALINSAEFVFNH